MGVDRIVSNLDSMMHYAGLIFSATNQQLMLDQKDNTLMLILIGAWIETLYLSCEMHASKNDVFAEKILVQKFPLQTLLQLMRSFPDDIIVNEYRHYFEDLYAAYIELDTVLQNQGLQTDSLAMQIVLKTGRVEITKEDLSEIRSVTHYIRNRIIGS